MLFPCRCTEIEARSYRIYYATNQIFLPTQNYPWQCKRCSITQGPYLRRQRNEPSQPAPRIVLNLIGLVFCTKGPARVVRVLLLPGQG
jgi:hypothetical protein